MFILPTVIRMGNIVALAALSACIATSQVALAADPCENLQDRVLYIDANGFEGRTDNYHGLTLNREADGKYHFRGALVFTNEPADFIVGTCVNRRIEFKRVRSGQFEQIYTGWIFERGGDLPHMAGVFSHNGQQNYGWCGRAEPPKPR